MQGQKEYTFCTRKFTSVLCCLQLVSSVTLEALLYLLGLCPHLQHGDRTHLVS